jgi:hypothetical protein
MSDESNQLKVICENCGIQYLATFDRLDHTGFISSFQSKSGVVIKDFSFCCYDCEKAFVERLEKKHPEIKGDWTPADSDQMTKYPEYYQERTCGLCGARKELQQSHIIPKFIAQWLKDTSASGFLRTGAGYRTQDTYKINLLCHDCEEMFSAWETCFAEQIFYAFQNGKTNLHYDDRLNKFMLSIAWRLLRVHLYELADDPIRKKHAETALEKWKDYLLGKAKEWKPYENHIFFLDTLGRQSTELPDRFLWYTLRSIDSMIATPANDEIFTFAKIPGILLVSSICPTEFEGWKVSKLDTMGVIELPQEIARRKIVQFLASRSTMIMGIKLSESEQDKITATMESKGEKRILESKTFETLLVEGKRRRRKLFDQLHPVIQQLLEILESAQPNGNRPPNTQAVLDFGLHLIANTLVELPKEKVEQLAREQAEAIYKSKSMGTDASSISDLEDIAVIMHVCPNSSKEQLRKKIEDSFTEIQEHGYFPKATETLVLAWNPLDDRPSFELSFEIR